MGSGSLVWRDRAILLAGWGIAAWAVFNALVAALALPRGVLVVLWLVVLVAVTVVFGLAAAGRFLSKNRLKALRRRPAVFALVIWAFAVLQLAAGRLPGESLWHAAQIIKALLAALAVLWLVYRRETLPLEAILLTGAWAVLLGIARATFPAPPLDLAVATGLLAADGAASPAFVTFLVGQAVQVALLAIPLALAVPTLRRVGRRALEWLLGWRLEWHTALLALVMAARAAYASLEGVRLLVPLALLRLALMAGVLAAGALAIRAVRAEPPPHRDETPGSAAWFWFAILVLAVVYVALAIPLARAQVGNVNPDGYAYLKIARDYAEGRPVVRGYWAPLMSWLLAPLIAWGGDPQAAQRAQTAAAGLVWALLTIPLASRFGLRRPARLAVAAMVALLVLGFGFALVTPDVVSAALLAAYFVLITGPRYVERPLASGVLAGLLGGLSYLAKSYNLPFVAAHGVLTGALLALHGRPARRVVLATGAALLTMLLVALPWVGLLAGRYGHVTISTSGAINHALVGPEQPGHPCWDDRLCPEPPDVLFPWEDPLIHYYPGHEWSALDSAASLDYQLGLIRANLREWAHATLLQLGALLPAGLVILAAAVLIEWRNLDRRSRYAWAALTVLLYAAGYMPVYASDFRYYYPVIPLLVIGVYGAAQAALDTLGRLLRPHPEWERQGVTAGLLTALALAGPLLATADLGRVTAYEVHSSCLRDDAVAFAGHLIPPTAGTDGAVNALAYYTRVRTLGGVSAFDDDPAAVDAALRGAGVATFIAPSEHGLTETLAAQYGYRPVARLPLCDVEYTILYVPDVGTP